VILCVPSGSVKVPEPLVAVNVPYELSVASGVPLPYMVGLRLLLKLESKSPACQGLRRRADATAKAGHGGVVSCVKRMKGQSFRPPALSPHWGLARNHHPGLPHPARQLIPVPAGEN
jgi:hypothetical protein